MNLKTLLIKRLAISKSTRKLRSTRERERSTPTYPKAKTPKLQTMEKTKSFNSTFLWKGRVLLTDFRTPAYRGQHQLVHNQKIEKQLLSGLQPQPSNGRTNDRS